MYIITDLKKQIAAMKEQIENNEFYDATDGHRWGDSSKELRFQLQILELKLENEQLKEKNAKLLNDQLKRGIE
jgi:hypothetical protein